MIPAADSCMAVNAACDFSFLSDDSKTASNQIKCNANSKSPV